MYVKNVSIVLKWVSKPPIHVFFIYLMTLQRFPVQRERRNTHWFFGKIAKNDEKLLVNLSNITPFSYHTARKITKHVFTKGQVCLLRFFGVGSGLIASRLLFRKIKTQVSEADTPEIVSK